jgi:hypothetical protein
MMLRASTLNFHPSHSMRTDGMPSVDSISRAVPMANNSLSANVIGKSDMAAVCCVASAHWRFRRQLCAWMLTGCCGKRALEVKKPSALQVFRRSDYAMGVHSTLF